MMYQGFSEMQKVVNRVYCHVDFDQESEYYRLEFGCERFKHISEDSDMTGDRKPVKGEPMHRLKWWKH